MFRWKFEGISGALTRMKPHPMHNICCMFNLHPGVVSWTFPCIVFLFGKTITDKTLPGNTHVWAWHRMSSKKNCTWPNFAVLEKHQEFYNECQLTFYSYSNINSEHAVLWIAIILKMGWERGGGGWVPKSYFNQIGALRNKLFKSCNRMSKLKYRSALQAPQISGSHSGSPRSSLKICITY